MTNQQISKLQSIDESKRASVVTFYMNQEKKTSTYVLLALFLGGFGIHHFYLGRTLAGVLSVVFFWTFIPAIFALIEILFSSLIIRNHNDKVFSQALLMAGAI